MYEITYTSDKKVEIDSLDDLIESVGWGRRGKLSWEEILSKSSFAIIAWDKDRVVGFGRALEDGVMCMIYDVVVHPDYQGHQIGSNIMKHILSEIEKRDYASVGVFAWEKNPLTVGFYEKHGFKSVSFGMKLIAR